MANAAAAAVAITEALNVTEPTSTGIGGIVLCSTTTPKPVK